MMGRFTLVVVRPAGGLVKKIVFGLLLLLAILHQDFWWWDDRTLVFGFMPVGLAWHAAISLVAGFLWLLAVMFCWPRDLENIERETSGAGEEGTGEEISP
jgi:hypothetical protein